ncbi:MAG: T9SS type B sorting domain-containing protein, partial [Bacteroidia bacterium]
LSNGTIPVFTQVLPMCAGATTSPLPTTSDNGITGTWSPVFNNSATNTYTFTPNSGQCALNTQMTITITPLPSVIATPSSEVFCSGGTTNIQLTSNVPGATFSWTVTGGNVVGSSGGSGTNINQTLTTSPGTTTTVEVVYTIIAEANGCAGLPTEVRVRVTPIPDLTIASSTTPLCSGETTNISFTGTIPGTLFNWVVTNITGAAGASNGTGTSIQQILTTTGLSQGSVTYEITPTFNGCAGTPQTVTVLVNPRPELFANPTHPPLCSGEPTFISVSTFNANTVLDWTVNAVGVNGALSGTNTGLSTLIQQTLTTSGNTQGYVDYTITPTLAGCSGTPIVVRVYVNPLPLPTLTDGSICVDEFGVPFQSYTLDSGLDNASYDFVWYFNGVAIPNSDNATYTAGAVGTYGVIATNSLTNCVSSVFPNMVTAVVGSTTPATSLTVLQSDYFSGNATLTVNVTGGSGTLMYSLDEGTLQASNVFTNVSAGPHTITVIDTQGCTFLTYDVFVIEYPQYFTPNGDGYNDGWFIEGLQDTDVIYIFDRYGKLIKRLMGEEAWDGTYNQEQLPSTDYWFTVDYLENGTKKQFKAHFSLKR